MTGTASLGKGARREAGSEGSLKAKLGLDEQEPGTRLVRWGNLAMDGDARQSLRTHRAGKLGGDLTYPGRFLCLSGRKPDYCVGNSAGGAVSRGHTSQQKRVGEGPNLFSTARRRWEDSMGAE